MRKLSPTRASQTMTGAEAGFNAGEGALTSTAWTGAVTVTAGVDDGGVKGWDAVTPGADRSAPGVTCPRRSTGFSAAFFGAAAINAGAVVMGAGLAAAVATAATGVVFDGGRIGATTIAPAGPLPVF